MYINPLNFARAALENSTQNSAGSADDSPTKGAEDVATVADRRNKRGLDDAGDVTGTSPPVAWMVVGKDGGWSCNEQRKVSLTSELSADLVSDMDKLWLDNAPHRSVPLYAHPPAPQPAERVREALELALETSEQFGKTDEWLNGRAAALRDALALLGQARE